MMPCPQFNQGGFPTGALLGATPAEALAVYARHGFTSPEIHPQSPDDPVMKIARDLFSDPSLHLPSYGHTQEEEALQVAHVALQMGYQRLIVHPYIVRQVESWRQLGSALVLENLDFRFPQWTTAQGLEPIFQALPEARFCLDLAHAYDDAPTKADQLLDAFSSRLAAIHYSEISLANGDHLASIREEVVCSHTRHLARLSEPVPLILEVGPNTEDELILLWKRVLTLSNDGESKEK